MKTIILKKRVELLLYVFIVLIASISFFVAGKELSFFAINSRHTPLLDKVMPIITHLGEGYLLIPVIAILLIIKVKYGFTLFFSYLSASFLTQLIKHNIPGDNFRPELYFYNDIRVHYVKDYLSNSLNSFPSGHSTLFFAVCMFVILLNSNKLLNGVLLIIGVCVAVSRVYLAQHFVEDIIVGSFIGSFFSILFYTMFIYKKSKLDDFAFWNYSLLAKLKT